MHASSGASGLRSYSSLSNPASTPGCSLPESRFGISCSHSCYPTRRAHCIAALPHLHYYQPTLLGQQYRWCGGQLGVFSTRSAGQGAPQSPKCKLKVSAARYANKGVTIERPSKNAGKREAKRMLDASRDLCQLSPKQLGVVAPLLSEDLVEAIAIARTINGRNQGRRRQEGLVGKLLRDFDDATQVQIQEAIQQAQRGQGPAGSSDVERLALSWREGLIVGDKEVELEVFGLSSRLPVDHQQIRQLVQQCKQEAAAAAASEALAQPSAADQTLDWDSAEAKKTKQSAATRLLRSLRPLASQAITANNEASPGGLASIPGL
ncbi:hypothetical protein WJX72_011698 [[Myrmecia] bisecta]|uniref:Uncharacterized protein n=1 Tax=[Myrmecia] bisecta TaxID=41462 RepID=A0AAW1QSY5_9CHLO